jgi:pSer/pThr/pTyr-binding forkhead associated (FHA) protein
MATLILYPETSDSRFIHLDKSSMLIGCAPDADICLESEFVSDCHARLEHKPDGDYLISLVNTPTVLVNGVEATFQQLKHGDTIKIGDVTAEYRLGDADATFDQAAPQQIVQSIPPATGSTAMVASPRPIMTCPQCARQLTPGVSSCPHCGLPITTLPAIPMDYIPPTPMSQSGPGILPVIAFLAGLTVIGAPIALVLGLMTFSIIRRRGGTIRDHAMAKWAVGLGLIWIMLGAGAAGKLVWQAHRHKQLSKVEVYEAKVIRALKNLACAQKYAHTIEFYDADSDGFGEYGELSALLGIQSPFFDPDIADGKAYAYQFSIREASEGRFLAVAEPINYAMTGGRTFAIDQDGQIRGGDAEGKRFGQIVSVLPVLQGERSAYYEIDDEIAKDVLNYVQSLSSSPEDQEKKQRIMRRLRKDYSLTSVSRELEGMESTVNRFVTEQRAERLYMEAQAALAEGSQDVALAKLTEIQNDLSAFSKIAAVERELIDLRSTIAQRREIEAADLFREAEEKERQGLPQREVQQLFQRIEKLYPDTEVAARITLLKPELHRQMRENNAEEIFSDLMELSPENEYDKILSQANQLRRNYNETDLFKKVEMELSKKERKARARAWRVKTEQNIAEGRMRGALAQLESAIRENPDLQYDLRDLCIRLYREVADTMMKEGDARGALVYYTQLNRLLQASDSKNQVSQEILAELHRDVGMADYERQEYQQARWHLASAAWQYPESAQFNMRLGSASLYTGLYRPAETALTQALTVQPDMEPALLYRAYLNMRVVLAFEAIISDAFQEKELFEDEEDETKEQSDEPAGKKEKKPTKQSLLTDNEDGTFTLEEESESGKNPEKEKTIRSRTWNPSATTGLFSPLAESGESLDSAIPEPTDLDLVFHYNYDTSRNILPDLLQFLQDLESETGNFKEELKGLRTGDANAVKLGQVMLISEFRNQLSDLRAAHLEDLAAQKELIEIMEGMKQRVTAAAYDIQAAGVKQPRIQTMAEQILPQIKEKHAFLYKSTNLLAGNMKKENNMRNKVFKVADESLRNSMRGFSPSLGGKSSDVSSYIKNWLYQTQGTSEIDQAMLMLRDSMEVSVDLKDILRAAEGVQ